MAPPPEHVLGNSKVGLKAQNWGTRPGAFNCKAGEEIGLTSKSSATRTSKGKSKDKVSLTSPYYILDIYP